MLTKLGFVLRSTYTHALAHIYLYIIYSITIFIQVSTAQRRLINDLSLKRRKFIGTTSMDAGLSLLMANQARINKGDLVMDPFVGSGSYKMYYLTYLIHYYVC